MGIEIDLTGPQGNAFYLIGTANNLCKQLGYDSKPVIDDMKAGDYDNGPLDRQIEVTAWGG